MRRLRVIAVLLPVAAAVLLAAPAQAAGARGEPPWESAELIRTHLFEAQQHLLLDEGAGSVAAVRAARAAYRGPLARGLRRHAARAATGIDGALRTAAAAARERDGVALAAARGTVQAALFDGAFQVLSAAIARGDAPSAARWLLLRDFRKATRFSRAGVDATIAVRKLAAREIAPGAAMLAVRKDLLDAYQSRLNDLLDASAAAARRGFDARRAELAALAAGYWAVLAPSYREQLGAAALARADRAFQVLAAAGRTGSARRYARRAAAARERLDGFVAAPFTDAEQARRAGQLKRFVGLIPVEYDHGVKDGRVTIPFEIQEAISFHGGAKAAFADLQNGLAKEDPAAARTLERSLQQLETYVHDASEQARVVPLAQVEQAAETALRAFDTALPERWEPSETDSDFDIIDVTLDRVEAAAGAGQYELAEQTRVEAYAFFEFGPELRLRPFDPGLVNDVEGLMWYGARDAQGLAKLIASHASRREIRATRLKLDEALNESRATLGDGGSTVSVITNSALIVFREGLEAVLILAAVTASFIGADRRRRRPVMIGAAVAVGASVATWALAQLVLQSFHKYGEKLEAITGLVAVAVLLVVLNWFLHKVYWTGKISKQHVKRKRLLAAATGGLISAQTLGLVLLGFTSVYREGFETVLFLQSLALAAGPWVVLAGIGLGMTAVAAVGVATFVLQHRLPYKRMLIYTGVLIAAVLVTMVGQTVRTMQGVGWISITPLDFDVPMWMEMWLGVFPTVETLGAQLGALVFVFGSYFAAEYVRVRRPRRQPRAPVPAVSSYATGSMRAVRRR